MKALLISLILLPLGAQASLNDFECSFTAYDGSDVLVEVQRSTMVGSKRIDVTVNSDEGIQRHQFFAFASINNATRRLEYRGGGIDLEIDLWPDARPRYGRTYRSEFQSYEVDNGRFNNIYCRYTGF